MRLQVTVGNARKGTFSYVIRPDDKVHPDGDTEERLGGLKPRIEAMSRQMLGDNFRGIAAYPNLLELKVTVGTAKAKKFELRDLLGWINLFDDEPRSST
jgi:hypothetical protein